MSTPSLALIPSGYKADKVYSVLPANGDGDFNFDRDCEATRINKDGLIEVVSNNVPRLDYTDSECPVLLLEPERTNLEPYSEQFDNWNKSNTIIEQNSIISPTGELSADKLIADTNTFNHYIQRVITVSTSSEVTFSVFVKKGEISEIQLLCAQNSSPFTNWARLQFDLNTLSEFGSNIGDFGYEDYGNDWIRIFVTGTPTSTSAIIRISLYKNFSNAFVGNNIDGLYLFGSQIEQGSYPTSYIPTTGSAVTRLKDTCKKINFNNIPSDYPFTTYWEGKINDYDSSVFTSQVAFSINHSGAFNCFFSLNFYNSSFLTLRRRNTTDDNVFISLSNDKNTKYKIAIVFIDATSVKVYVNGTEVLNSTSLNSVPYISTDTPDSIAIGQLRDNADSGKRNSCDKFLLFNEELSNSELIKITS